MKRRSSTALSNSSKKGSPSPTPICAVLWCMASRADEVHHLQGKQRRIRFTEMKGTEIWAEVLKLKEDGPTRRHVCELHFEDQFRSGHIISSAIVRANCSGHAGLPWIEGSTKPGGASPRRKNNAISRQPKTNYIYVPHGSNPVYPNHLKVEPIVEEIIEEEINVSEELTIHPIEILEIPIETVPINDHLIFEHPNINNNFHLSPNIFFKSFLPGFQNEIFERLADLSRDWSELKRKAVLSMDYMSCIADLTYIPEADSSFGFVNIGNGSICTSDKEVNLFLFVLSGLYEDWNYVISYFITSKCTEDSIYKYIIEGNIRRLSNIGINVRCVVPDKSGLMLEALISMKPHLMSSEDMNLNEILVDGGLIYIANRISAEEEAISLWSSREFPFEMRKILRSPNDLFKYDCQLELKELECESTEDKENLLSIITFVDIVGSHLYTLSYENTIDRLREFLQKQVDRLPSFFDNEKWGKVYKAIYFSTKTFIELIEESDENIRLNAMNGDLIKSIFESTVKSSDSFFKDKPSAGDFIKSISRRASVINFVNNGEHYADFIVNSFKDYEKKEETRLYFSSRYKLYMGRGITKILDDDCADCRENWMLLEPDISRTCFLSSKCMSSELQIIIEKIIMAFDTFYEQEKYKSGISEIMFNLCEARIRYESNYDHKNRHVHVEWLQDDAHRKHRIDLMMYFIKELIKNANGRYSETLGLTL